MYQHEVYVPCLTPHKDIESIKKLLTDMHGGCTAYTAVGHWNDESEETTREYVWILRVVSESDVFSGLNLIESALFKHGEKCVMSTTQKISARFKYDNATDTV
jgi:hypothetical protein